MRYDFRRITVLILTMSLIILAACGPNLAKLGEKSPEEQFVFGKELFYDEDYENAQIVFERTARLNIIADFADSIQFLLAESYFKTKKYILAQSEYERLIQYMPGSSLVRDAKFQIGMCYYNLSPRPTLDQEYTDKAIKAFNDFLVDYPLDETYGVICNEKIIELRNRIAEKYYLNGDLYRKMGDYESSIIYFDIVLKEYYDSPIAARTLVQKADSFYKMDKLEEAQETLQIFLENFPEHELFPRVQLRMDEVKTAIAKTDSLSVPY